MPVPGNRVRFPEKGRQCPSGYIGARGRFRPGMVWFRAGTMGLRCRSDGRLGGHCCHGRVARRGERVGRCRTSLKGTEGARCSASVCEGDGHDGVGILVLVCSVCSSRRQSSCSDFWHSFSCRYKQPQQTKAWRKAVIVDQAREVRAHAV